MAAPGWSPRSESGFNYYRASGTPASADYAVEADVHVKSLVLGDKAGVVGRFDSAALEDWYEVSYDRTSGQWVLRKSIDQSVANIGTPAAQTLSAGATYRLRLEMIGSSIKLYVDGDKVLATDASITGVGKGGVFSGNSGASSTVSNTTGLHLDDFQIVPTTAATAADSKGTATGTYHNGPTLGVAGALSGDSDTAVRFDGVDDYVSAARQVQDDLSLEFWFKSTQGLGVDPRWTLGAGMVDANVTGLNNDFGVSLRSDGRVVGGSAAAPPAPTRPSSRRHQPSTMASGITWSSPGQGDRRVQALRGRQPKATHAAHQGPGQLVLRTRAVRGPHHRLL